MISAKRMLTLLLSFLSIIVAVSSCYKPPHYPLPNPNPDRKIQYELFTEIDLAKDNHDILFSLFVEHADGKAIWDSSIAPMKIKDIPSLANKLIAQKTLTDTGLLRVGFRYTIVDIGFSGLVDTIHANNNFKVVALSFR